jgi:DMSO/TMAO reductase YedYZ molybdopterin-dependent catalytic subunit
MPTTTETHVTVNGEDAVRVPVPLPEDHGYETTAVEETFRCSSGTAISEGWTGLAVGALLFAADTPPETTHIQVEGADGFTVCVPIGAALDGVLAFDGGQSVESAPRFAAPGISGTRTVKGVRRLNPIALDPTEHPEQWEDLRLEEK